jgi:hypothetical protein
MPDHPDAWLVDDACNVLYRVDDTLFTPADAIWYLTAELGLNPVEAELYLGLLPFESESTLLSEVM